MTTIRAGSATHVGQVRSINQDAPMIVADDDLYGVADGMGGHQGGEVASAMAVELTRTHAAAPTLDALKEAVRMANRAIFEKAGGDRELHGMGTTMVAVRLVEGPEGDEIAWVNVGDSRVYLLRDDRLVQLSEDHSLVEDLVRDGQISPEEAAVHPQRNILTRALGIDLDVNVDGNTVLPFTGDRFLLCSDGLFNEVSTDDMTTVLRRLEDPDEAATELVRLANEGGGRDNITVVVVDVVDDGGRAAAASVAMADEPTTMVSTVPPSRSDSADEGPDGAAAAASDDAIGADEPTAVHETVFAGARSSLPDPDGDYTPPAEDLYGDLDKARFSHLTWRVIAFLLVLAVVGAVVIGAIGWSANRTYFVGYQGEQVALYRGKPGGVLWFDPSVVDTRDISRADTVEPFRSQVAANKQFGSRDEADRFLRNLREQVEQDQASTSTTTAPTTTTPATTAPPTTAPATTVAPPSTPAAGP